MSETTYMPGDSVIWYQCAKGSTKTEQKVPAKAADSDLVGGSGK